MTAPIVFNQPTFGEILNQAAAPLLQTLRFQAEQAQRQQQLQLEAGRLYLQQQDFESKQSELRAHRKDLEGQGLALNQALQALSQQRPPPYNPQAPLMQEPRVQYQPGSATPVQTTTVPSASPTGTPAYRPPAPAPGVAPEVAALQLFSRNAPPARVGEGLQVLEPVMRQAAQLRKDQEATRQETAAIDTIRAQRGEPYAAAAQGILAFAKAGANLSATMVAEFYPQLAQSGVDPSAVNAASTLWKSGVFTWGQARVQLGIPKVQGGPPDDLKYVAPTRSSSQGIQAVKAAAFLQIMEPANAIAEALGSVDGGGLDLKGAFYAALKKGAPWLVAVNEIVDPKQQQYVNAIRRFVDAQVYFLSGAQTNEAEFLRQFSYTADFINDAPETRAQKRAMRASMIGAVREVAQGQAKPSEAVQRMLMTAREGGWNRAIIAGLERQLADAKAWERSARYKKTVYAGDDRSPVDWGTVIRENY